MNQYVCISSFSRQSRIFQYGEYIGEGQYSELNPFEKSKFKQVASTETYSSSGVNSDDMPTLPSFDDSPSDDSSSDSFDSGSSSDSNSDFGGFDGGDTGGGGASGDW